MAHTGGDHAHQQLQRLSERDAWDIALAWRDQLQGCVRLEIDASLGASFRMVDSFEWVTFMFNGARDDGFEEVTEPLDAAQCARAASIAWFALSCCSGFSGTENPRFWRRVFSELHAPRGHQLILRRPRAQLHITDAVRFFDHVDRPFPRVRIEPNTEHSEACIRAFLGRTIESQPDEEEPSSLDTMLETLGVLFSLKRPRRRLSTSELDARLNDHSARLDAILKQLQPFIRRSHWRRRLPMAIRGVNAVDLAWILPSLRSDHDQQCSLQCEQMQLESVFLRDDDMHLETAVRSLLVKTHVTVVLPKVALPWLTANSRVPLSLMLGSNDAVSGQRLRIGALTTVSPHEATFTALCSMLPHSKRITTVQLDAKSTHVSTIIGLRATEWAWLGYAFFHPDATCDSAFAQLDLDHYRIIERNLESLRSMARGNNLLIADQATGVAPSSSSLMSDHYRLGTLRAGTVVHASPDEDADHLMTVERETRVTLCRNWNAWVCVVVPGIGLGWILRQQIYDIITRPPGTSSLRALRLNIESSFGGLGPILQLLAIVGERLTYLHIVGRRNPLNADAVGAIVRLCPSLISLRICHDGSFWADPVAAATVKFPQLQALELVIGSYQHLPVLSPLRSPLLDHLQTLRVVTLAKTSFATNRATFVDVLARYPELQYANWSLGWSHTGCSPLRSYDEHQAASLARFGTHADSLEAFVHRPLENSCRAAFLSVILHDARAHQVPISALSGFGRDIVTTIFAFATTPTRREFYVDDEVEFVTGHFRN